MNAEMLGTLGTEMRKRCFEFRLQAVLGGRPEGRKAGRPEDGNRKPEGGKPIKMQIEKCKMEKTRPNYDRIKPWAPRGCLYWARLAFS